MPQTVRLIPTDLVLEIRDGETILDAALRRGLNLPHSCKGGSCRLCLARLVEGEIRYPAGRPAGLTPEDAKSGMTLMCRGVPVSDTILSVTHVSETTDVGIKRLPCRVERAHRLCDDVMALFLRLPVVERLDYRAGQYIDVMLSGERRRSFSIANAPGSDSRLEIHVRKVPGGEFTGRVFDAPATGALLEIEGPLGHFVLHDNSTRPLLMVAGGTGFAPLKAMLRQLIEEDTGRSVKLYWGALRERNLYLQEELRALEMSWPAFEYTPVLSAVGDGDGWTGRTGLVHEAALRDHPTPAHFDVYVSGPPGMVESARSDFAAAGLPGEQFFFDSFDYAPDSAPGRAPQP